METATHFGNSGENPAIDPERAGGDIGVGLQSTEPTTEESQPRPRGRRKWKRWALLVLILGGAFWLNGPGLRWLAPHIADHFLAKSGLRGHFSLEGSITGGISVKDLRLESDKALASLTINSVTPVYQFRELLKGHLDSLSIDGLHADLRLGLEAEKQKPEDKTPLDLEALVKTLRTVRSKVIPTSIDLKNISLNATKDGKSVIALAPSHIRHAAGDPFYQLDLGAITDATGREWPAQQSRIGWTADELTIDQVDPLPGVGIRDLVVRLPETGGPSAETELHVDDAVFLVGASPGLSAVRVDLREGRLPGDKVAERFGIKLPVSGELTSLSVNVEHLLPDPMAATGEVRLLLENVVSGEWTVSELSLDAGLLEDRSTLAASGQALGTAFSLDAETPIVREGGGLKPGDVSGRFHLDDVPKLVGALSEKFKAIDPAAPVPPSSVDGKFSVSMKDLRPGIADVDLALKPVEKELASPVAVKARWQPDQPVTAEVALDGILMKGSYDLKSATYEAGLDLSDFKSARIDRWLAVARADSKGAVQLNGKWNGSGEVKANKHHGLFTLANADLTREGMPPVNANCSLDYDWPAGFSMKGLRVQAKDQVLSADAKLADGLIELTSLRWQDHGTEIAGGNAKLPVPEDFSKWRETLAHDKRPLEVAIESKTLSLALLKDWVPAAAKLDPRSNGRVSLKVSGTYADPVVDALLEAKDLRSPEQPKLPPAELRFTLAGKEGRLSVDGSAKAPDFPPAVLSASMPFRPAEWAEQPDLVKAEKITARVDLPRIDLSRFSTLVAPAKKVSGYLTGNVEIAGELAKPAIKGKLDLTGGGIELKDVNQPPITGLAASVDLTLERITLSNLKATVAGGTLQGGGSLTLKDAKPGDLDFRVTANHLPLLRNDSLIVRSNADLRLAGPWERAALTGTVGVVDSLFYRDIELLPIGTPFTAPSAAALPKIDAPANPAASVPEPFRNWTVNVLARSENPILVRGNFATGSIDVNVRVGGTVGSPAPNGEVKISDFRAALPFSTLSIRSGFLRFKPETGFDPILEIRGSAEPRPYQVSVFVYGRASNPQLVLTSNPPMPENEIMTLLATGTTTTGLEDPQAASSRAMQLLAEELRRGRFAVGKRLRPLLGLLDRVDFSLAEKDPYSNDSFSTATLQLAERWYVSAGMGSEGDTRVMGIWRVSFR